MVRPARPSAGHDETTPIGLKYCREHATRTRRGRGWGGTRRRCSSESGHAVGPRPRAPTSQAEKAKLSDKLNKTRWWHRRICLHFRPGVKNTEIWPLPLWRKVSLGCKKEV